jgi:ATP phosphoribosyltransferase regulatory subunit
VFRALIEAGRIDAERASDLFDAMRIKDIPEIAALVADLPQPARDSFLALPELYGEANAVLERAIGSLPSLPAIGRALHDLRTLVEAISGRDDPGGAHVAVQVDLAELRDLDYHNGVVFSAYAEGHAVAIGRGGRYDNIGGAFGRDRPATGFSLYPRQLAERVRMQGRRPGVLAPDADDPALKRAIDALRAAGDIVVIAIEGAEVMELADPPAHDCDRRLAFGDGQWRVERIVSESKQSKDGQ